MLNQKIRLIYSASPSPQIAKERDNEWEFANARQLGLFDDLERIKILFVPIAEISVHFFIKALDEKEPFLILDTRIFPDFFSVFSSIESAMDEFHQRGIEYNRTPIQFELKDESVWHQLNTIKSLFLGYLEKKVNSPVFILSSTQKNLEKVSNKLKGYISQEVSGANFEELNF